MAFAFELGIILLFSIIGGVLAVRFKQPSVLGLILVGAFVGPHNLGFIKDTSLINNTIEIGAVLLLFTVGIEFSLPRLLNVGFRAVLLAIVKLGIVFFLGYYAAFLFGLGPLTSVYVGVILSITSTVIFVKILEQKGMAGRSELPLLITILIIEDIYGVFVLTFFSGLNAKTDLVPLQIFAQLIISLAILIVAYVILKKILKRLLEWLIKYSTEDTITFISIGLCAGMSYLAHYLHLSPSVGAFLAGNIVASLSSAKIFEKALHPFILTFTALFFFSIGTIVDFSSVRASIWLIIILFLINSIGKLMSIGVGSYILGNFNGAQAAFSGIAMISIGEFSLLIAKEAANLDLGIDLVSITAMLILLSSVSMSSLISYSEPLYKGITGFAPKKVLQNISKFSVYLNSLSLSMISDKFRFKKMNSEIKNIARNLIAVFFIVAVCFFGWHYLNATFGHLMKSPVILLMTVLVAGSVIFFPVIKIVRNTKDLFGDIVKAFLKLYPQEIAHEKKIFRNALIVCGLFIGLMVFPAVFLFFELHPLINLVLIIPLGFIGWFAVNSSAMIQKIARKHAKQFKKRKHAYAVARVKEIPVESKAADSEKKSEGK